MRRGRQDRPADRRQARQAARRLERGADAGSGRWLRERGRP